MGVLMLVAVPAAAAGSAQVSVTATPATGPAPLTVALTADAPGAASFHWDLGDGTAADGPTIEHTYGAGSWQATLTAGFPDGTSATASVDVVATGLALKGPKLARYGRRVAFRGSLVPGRAGIPVVVDGPRDAFARGTTRADGTFGIVGKIHVAGSYTARTLDTTSAPADVTVIPRLQVRVLGNGARGSRYTFEANALPAEAGQLAVTIVRAGQTLVERTWTGPVRIGLDTRRVAAYRIHVELEPAAGYTAVARLVTANVVMPRLAVGARGASVAELAARLRELHYAAPVTASFDSELLDAVYAFEKVQGLPRSGVADASFWRRLESARIPVPRYSGPSAHIEIDKPHQVLYVVRASRVALIVPVSTAGLPGKFTPVGRFAIYREVPGFDPSPLGTLYDPMYFTGGYAIHGNPSVPPYPASHGCVRVPMWLAPRLYATNPYGETVYVY